MKLYAKLAALLIFMCCIHTQVQAKWEPGYVLSGSIKDAKAKGTVFQPISLFTITEGASLPALTRHSMLLPDAAAIKKLYDSRADAIAITMKAATGKEYVLELLPSSPLAANPDMGYIDEKGRHKCGVERGAHYQGAIRGEDKSIATLSVFANGDVMMLFSNQEGNFVVGKMEDNSGRYILYNDQDFTVKPPSPCGVDDYDKYDAEYNDNTGNKTTAAYGCKKVSIYWESDYQLYQSKGGFLSLTQNYLIAVFNNVQALYRNEKIAVELKSVYIWKTDDGYVDGPTSSGPLNDFQDKWNAKGDTFEGDLAMLLAVDGGGLGGVAFRDVLCNRNSAYAYGDINGTYQNIPTYSWDVSMITHEHGHNFGSRHTHWCGWMTGAGSTCGSIDDCTTKESSSGCSSCGFEQFQDSQPSTAWKGTIMSYCHLVSRGISLANGFGPLPGNAIRADVAGAGCLKSIVSFTLTAKSICQADGAVTLVFDNDTIGTSNFGAAPYTYKWSPSANSQNLNNLRNPGLYIVEVTDSNGCKNGGSVTVTTDTKPGCWPASVGSMALATQSVNLYPNPAHNSVNLQFFANTTSNISVKVTDMVGKTIDIEQLTVRTGENNTQINTSGWAKGMYYVSLQSATERFEVVKLIVE